jgi:glycosyltransferase involved in cell wall biosynthesis
MEPSSLRLLVLSIEFPPGPGGLGTLAYQISQCLTEMGWQVAVATPQSHTNNQTIQAFNNHQIFKITQFVYKGPAILEGFNRLFITLQLIRSHKPNVILAIGWQSVWLGSLIALLTNIPCVAVGIGSEFLILKKVKRAMALWAYQRADLVVFISQYTRKLAQSHGFHTFKDTIISLGADEDIFKPELNTKDLRQQLKLNDSLVILTVGQVSERKAQDVVIRALPSVLEDFPTTHYLIVGLPTNRARLEQLANKLGVKENIHFTGVVPQNDLPLFYNLADIFILVSRRTEGGEVEGFGIAVVEAALCGKPAIVSNATGLVEAVVPGMTALVVDPEQPEMTAAAIKQLLANDQLRYEMGVTARRHALDKATWRQQIKKFDHQLRNLIEMN